jgi:hypothetical protein
MEARAVPVSRITNCAKMCEYMRRYCRARDPVGSADEEIFGEMEAQHESDQGRNRASGMIDQAKMWAEKANLY